MKNINDKLSVKKFIDFMQMVTDFRFNVFEMMSSLTYARLVQPCFKPRTQIPISMKIFPGNESEKPVIQDIIDELKQRNNIHGKTIQVADKGLNCAENIYHALKNGDGFIFSKFVKQLPKTERTWVLLSNDYREVKNAQGKRAEYGDCAKYVIFTMADKKGKDTNGTVKVSILS